jgi:hypothetical protein
MERYFSAEYSRCSCRSRGGCHMLTLFRMKALLGFVGCSLSIAVSGFPASAAAGVSATAGWSEIASVADVQRHPLDFDRAGWENSIPKESSPSASADFMKLCTRPAPRHALFDVRECAPQPDAAPTELPATLGNKAGDNSGIQPVDATPHAAKPADFNREIYYRNKLEFSLEGGWHPINIPFPLDVFVGDAYNTYPLKYTLVPIFASFRWHMGNIWGPSILRGNFDMQFTGSVTGVARGPESHYFAYLMGIRRNFVPPNSRIAPYFDVRLGVGNIDAKGPKGVLYAQGQNLTFTINIGSGVRYNFGPRYSISGGLNFMHISNLDLSESNGKPNWGVRNYGINVYGPMVGIDVQLRRHPRHSE